MIQPEGGCLGGFSRQRLENRQKLRGVRQGFFRQRLENGRILEEELPAGPQTGGSESRETEVFRQIRHQSLAIGGPVRALLFELDDPAASDPVAHGERAIRHRGHALAQGSVQVADAEDEIVKLHEAWR